MGEQDWHVNPADMTPEERSEQLIKLLARALVRLCSDEKEGIKALDSKNIRVDPRLIKRKGPLPFGTMMTQDGIVANATEMALINRMKQLAEQGISTEKIAGILNEENHRTRRGAKWTRSLVWRILKRYSVRTCAK